MRLPHRRSTTATVITEAEPSRTEQSDARMRRYLILMGIRTVSLVLATVFYREPLLLLLFGAMAVVLPWVAVLIANDRPAKRPIQVPFLHRRHHGPRIAPPRQEALPAPQVIDAEADAPRAGDDADRGPTGPG